MTQYITVTDLATHSRDVMDIIRNGGSVIVLYHHKPIAVINPIDPSDIALKPWEFQMMKEKKNGP